MAETSCIATSAQEIAQKLRALADEIESRRVLGVRLSTVTTEVCVGHRNSWLQWAPASLYVLQVQPMPEA